jgi:hypothetical protein
MFGKSCLIIGRYVNILKSTSLIRTDPPIIRQLLPNILMSTPLIRTDPPIIRQLLPNILKSTPLIRTDPPIIRQRKSCLIIGGSVLIREVDFRMFGKS